MKAPVSRRRFVGGGAAAFAGLAVGRPPRVTASPAFDLVIRVVGLFFVLLVGGRLGLFDLGHVLVERRERALVVGLDQRIVVVALFGLAARGGAGSGLRWTRARAIGFAAAAAAAVRGARPIAARSIGTAPAAAPPAAPSPATALAFCRRGLLRGRVFVEVEQRDLLEARRPGPGLGVGRGSRLRPRGLRAKRMVFARLRLAARNPPMVFARLRLAARNLRARRRPRLDDRRPHDLARGSGRRERRTRCVRTRSARAELGPRARFETPVAAAPWARVEQREVGAECRARVEQRAVEVDRGEHEARCAGAGWPACAARKIARHREPGGYRVEDLGERDQLELLARGRDHDPPCAVEAHRVDHLAIGPAGRPACARHELGRALEDRLQGRPQPRL